VEIDILRDMFVTNEEIKELTGDTSSESKNGEEEIQMEDVKDMDTGAEVEVDDATENKTYDSVEVKECVSECKRGLEFEGKIFDYMETSQ